MKLLIDINEKHYKRIKWVCENGMGDSLQKKVANGTPIDNATNGDILQNIFPDDIWLQIYARRAKKSTDWWNSPYQKGGKERDYDVECRNHCEMMLNAQKGGKE